MMKAVVKYGQLDGMVEVRQVPIPEIGPSDVLLEVKAAGICGSDIEMWRHRCTYRVNTPVIQGHEFCGVISKRGKEVTEFKVGDRVVSETSAYICGKCRFCKAGDYNLCPDRLGFGYGTDGAFTKYVKVRKEILHSIPASISFEEAAITEPCCVAYNALIVRSRIKPGDTVIIIGPGPIGLFCLQVARLCGAGKVVIVGRDADRKRLNIAKELGADLIINSGCGELVNKIMDLTDGLGADLVVDAAGSSRTLKQSLAMVRRLGQITKIGWGPDPVGFSLDLLITKSATLQGTYGHNWRTWQRVLKLMTMDRIKMKPMISDIFSITDWEKAYRLVESCQAVKVLLKP
jgi:alcohol dehydrogenase/L-iditol 2-dehydrogenase